MVKTKLLLLLSILYNYNSFYAQTNSIGSIKKGILKESTYQELENRFYDNTTNDIEEKKDIGKYFLQKAKLEKNKEQIAEGYVMVHFDENLANALKYLDSLQIITKDSKQNYYPTRTYLLRGNLHFRFDNFQTALDNYILGLKYAKQKNNKRQIAIADISIARLNNYIGKHEEALKTLKNYLYHADYLTQEERNSLKLNLADVYIEIRKMDSAYILIQEGIRVAKNNNVHEYYQNLSVLGYYNIMSKKYQVAIDNLLPCKKYFFSINDKREQNYVLLNLGRSYAGLKEKKKALGYFTQIDSMVQKTNYVFPELREVYAYIIDYYKEIKDKEKQLYYVERFLDVNDVLNSRFRYISREIPRRYDTPKLIEEKENITYELQKKKMFFDISVGFLIIALLLLISFYFKYKKAEKKYRKIAQDLIQSVDNNKTKKVVELRQAESLNNSLHEKIGNIENKIVTTISEDLTQAILKELQTFEAKEQFLHKGITLGTLAKKVRTNSRYLSEIINTHKGKNFATYLNDLRIDYAINRLANDKKFRHYKIPFIAEELGYNNEQAFTLAFKKRTGTPLSIYLKEIGKVKD